MSAKLQQPQRQVAKTADPPSGCALLEALMTPGSLVRYISLLIAHNLQVKNKTLTLCDGRQGSTWLLPLTVKHWRANRAKLVTFGSNKNNHRQMVWSPSLLPWQFCLSSSLSPLSLSYISPVFRFITKYRCLSLSVGKFPAFLHPHWDTQHSVSHRDIWEMSLAHFLNCVATVIKRSIETEVEKTK